MRSALAAAVVCIVIAVAFRLMSTFRDYVAQDRQTTTDVLANLDEMRQRGDISEEEFRTMESRAKQLGVQSPDESSVTSSQSPPTDAS